MPGIPDALVGPLFNEATRQVRKKLYGGTGEKVSLSEWNAQREAKKAEKSEASPERKKQASRRERENN
jgi:hypothetical protein